MCSQSTHSLHSRWVDGRSASVGVSHRAPTDGQTEAQTNHLKGKQTDKCQDKQRDLKQKTKRNASVSLCVETCREPCTKPHWAASCTHLSDPGALGDMVLATAISQLSSAHRQLLMRFFTASLASLTLAGECYRAAPGAAALQNAPAL